MALESDWQGLKSLLMKVKSRKQMDELLKFFLTPHEREMLGNRYQIIQKLLEADATQREISETLGLSISKITSGSNALKVAPDSIQNFLRTQMGVSKTAIRKR